MPGGGGKPVVISTVHMECSADSRLVMAGGTMMNVAAAALFFALGRITSRTSPLLKYFFWLLMTVNLFIAAGYFAFSGIGGFVDWAMFAQGLGPQWAWRVGMTIFGAAAYMLVAWLSLLELRPLIGSDRDQRLFAPYGCRRCRTLPEGFWRAWPALLSAAASTFGGTSGLLWMTDWLKGSRVPLGGEPEPMPIRRSWPWVVTAGILALAFVVVLGPGVRFSQSVEH
jgi:hypothetical protein